MLSQKRFASFAVLAVTTLSVSACGGGSSSPSAQQPVGLNPDPNPPVVVLTKLDVAPNAAEGVVASLGADVSFTATGTFSDGTISDVTASVTWSSSNPDVAAFSSGAGLATPVAVGSTEITATHPASGIHSSVSLSIVTPFAPPPGDSSWLAISPIDPMILIGTTLQLSASGWLADDTLDPVDMTNNVTWSSSDETIATVSATGLATAVALGSCTITATDPVTQESDSITFSVTDVPAALAYVTRSRGSVIGGSSTEVTGTVVLTSYAVDPVVVTLWTDDASVSVPESVTVAAGTGSASFEITTFEVAHRTRVFIYASDGTYTKKARLNLRAPKK
jgi:hypothetical protein